jgi:hypothetical protein
MFLAMFWAILPQTHLATLLPAHTEVPSECLHFVANAEDNNGEWLAEPTVANTVTGTDYSCHLHTFTYVHTYIHLLGNNYKLGIQHGKLLKGYETGSRV